MGNLVKILGESDTTEAVKVGTKNVPTIYEVGTKNVQKVGTKNVPHKQYNIINKGGEAEDKTDRIFWRYPRNIMKDTRLSKTEKDLLVYIMNIWIIKKGNTIHPSNTAIAENICASQEHIKQYKARLKELEFINMTPSKGRNTEIEVLEENIERFFNIDFFYKQPQTFQVDSSYFKETADERLRLRAAQTNAKNNKTKIDNTNGKQKK